MSPLSALRALVGLAPRQVFTTPPLPDPVPLTPAEWDATQAYETGRYPAYTARRLGIDPGTPDLSVWARPEPTPAEQIEQLRAEVARLAASERAWYRIACNTGGLLSASEAARRQLVAELTALQTENHPDRIEEPAHAHA